MPPPSEEPKGRKTAWILRLSDSTIDWAGGSFLGQGRPGFGASTVLFSQTLSQHRRGTNIYPDRKAPESEWGGDGGGLEGEPSEGVDEHVLCRADLIALGEVVVAEDRKCDRGALLGSDVAAEAAHV